ncbi:Probable pectinesterase/pectinesterase inhibitor 35 [Linum perenne]
MKALTVDYPFFLLPILLLIITSTTGTNPRLSPLHFSKSSRSSSSSSSSLFDISVQKTLTHTQFALTTFSSSSASSGAVLDCLELLDDTLDQLSNVAYRHHNRAHTHDDVQTWLSASLTNQVTCKETLLTLIAASDNNNHDTTTKAQVLLLLSLAQNMTTTIENSLALYMNHIHTNPLGRKLMLVDTSNKFPGWLSSGKKKVLESSLWKLEAHAVVAMDGSGTHTSIAMALRETVDADESSVIYVKAGIYRESINIGTKQKNVMLVGDGKGKTVIVGNKNVHDGSTTFRSATVAAMGDGFMARDITFINDAGPTKHQAVALRVGSDHAVIYRCSIMGYQDTLYTHSKRQFYRDTDIYGTIDFIFGNSAAVFQNCNIYARKGGSYPNNFITAQGRSSPYQNTGISIHNCRVQPSPDLPVGSRSTYLGRPWKEYSRTVVMES